MIKLKSPGVYKTASTKYPKKMPKRGVIETPSQRREEERELKKMPNDNDAMDHEGVREVTSTEPKRV